MPLIKNNQFVDDPWHVLGDGDQALVTDGTDIVVSYDRWKNEREVLLRRNGRLGVKLSSDQPPSLIEDDLVRLDLVLLDFPRFADGRGFSYARLLRERYGFAGEIRAVGAWFRDQVVFLQRCGVDAFEVSDDQSLDGWRSALQEFSVVYQPAADGQSWISSRRSSARSTAAE